MPPPPPVASSSAKAKSAASSVYDDVRSSADLLAWAGVVDTGAAGGALGLQGSDEPNTNKGNNAERDEVGMGGMLWEESSIGSEAPPDVAAVDDDDAGKVEAEVEVEVVVGSAAPVSFIERYMQKRKAGATEVEAYHQASEEEAAAMKAAGGGAGGESLLSYTC
jgi:hypothetical protein